MSDQNEILQLFEQWNSALQIGDPDQILSQYAADAVLLPTLSPVVCRQPDAIRRYFTEIFLPFRPRGAMREANIRIFGEIAINSGIYEFSVIGREEAIPVRFTFVYRRQNDGWKIVEHHSSALPEEPTPPMVKDRPV